MPLEPQNVPQVGSTGNIDSVGLRTDFNPSTVPFGGRTSEALGELSQGLGQAGQDVFNIVQEKQAYANEAAAQNAATEYMKKATGLYQDYQGLQGDAARAALPKFQNDLQELWNQSRASVGNPQAQRMLDKGARWYLERYYSMAEEHSAREHQQYLTESANALIDTYGNQAILSLNNPEKMQQMLDLGAGQIENYGQKVGWDQTKIQLEESKFRGKYLVDAIKLKGDDGDLSGASTLFEQNKDRMDAASQVAAATYLRPKLKSSNADAQLVSILGESNAADVGVTAPSGTGVAGNVLDSFKAATTQQESGGKQFKPDGTTVTSPKGALGISQLMPGTAEDEAKRMGIPYDFDRLKNDEGYNKAIGDHLKARLLQEYGDPTLAAAAYNAGEGAVDGWLKTIGDPRTGQISNAQWTARIPYDETRNYVLAIGSRMAGQPAAPAPDGSSAPPTAWPAKEDALRHAIDITAGDPEARNALLSRLNQAYAIHDAMTKETREGTERYVNDAIVAADNGVDVSNFAMPSVPAMVSIGIDKGRATILTEEFQVAKHASEVLQGVQWSSPEEIQNAQRDLMAGTGVFADLFHPAGKGRPTTGPGMVEGIPDQAETIMYARQRMQIAARFDQQLQRRAKMLVGPDADPAQYVAGAPPVQAAIGALRDAPVTGPDDMEHVQDLFSQYAKQTLAMQDHLGIPEAEQHLLPKQHSLDMATEIQKPGTDVKAKLDQWHQQYGDMFPRVMHDLVTQGKLPATYQMVDMVDTPLDAAQMSRGLQEGINEEKAENLIGEQNVSNISTGIVPLIQQDAGNPDTELGKYLDSLRLSGASVDQRNQVINGVETLALTKAAIFGTGVTDARTQAVQAFTSKYEYLPGGARVPVASAAATGQNIQHMLGQMTPQTIDVPDEYGKPGNPAAQEYIDGIKANPMWITRVAPNGGTALWMLDQKARIVRTRDGKPFQVPISTTPMPGVTVAPPAAATTAPVDTMGSPAGG